MPDAGHRGQIADHAFDDACVRQHRAEKAHGIRILDHDGREILDVEGLELIGMRFDVDPREADFGMRLRERLERGAVFAASAAPFGAQSGDQQDGGIGQAFGDPGGVGI